MMNIPLHVHVWIFFVFGPRFFGSRMFISSLVRYDHDWCYQNPKQIQIRIPKYFLLLTPCAGPPIKTYVETYEILKHLETIWAELTLQQNGKNIIVYINTEQWDIGSKVLETICFLLIVWVYFRFFFYTLIIVVRSCFQVFGPKG